MEKSSRSSGSCGQGAHGAERGVRLVHVPVGGHPQVVLGDARAAEEARLAEVAGLRVDLHGLTPGPAPGPLLARFLEGRHDGGRGAADLDGGARGEVIAVDVGQGDRAQARRHGRGRDPSDLPSLDADRRAGRGRRRQAQPAQGLVDVAAAGLEARDHLLADVAPLGGRVALGDEARLVEQVLLGDVRPVPGPQRLDPQGVEGVVARRGAPPPRAGPPTRPPRSRAPRAGRSRRPAGPPPARGAPGGPRSRRPGEPRGSAGGESIADRAQHGARPPGRGGRARSSGEPRSGPGRRRGGARGPSAGSRSGRGPSRAGRRPSRRGRAGGPGPLPSRSSAPRGSPGRAAGRRRRWLSIPCRNF